MSDTRERADEAFRERMHISACLSELLCEHIWNGTGKLRLGGADFEVLGGDEVPGYEDDNETVLLRRRSDGAVFEVLIEPEVRRVYEPAAAVTAGKD